MRRIHTLETFTLRVGRAPSWQVAIVLVVACALALALALLVGGLFLILLPVVLVGGLAARFIARRAARTPRPDREVIEAEYEMIDDRAGDRTASGENLRDK